MRQLLFTLFVCLYESPLLSATTYQWVDIPEGQYQPLFLPSTADPKGQEATQQPKVKAITLPSLVKVSRFKLQSNLVTNSDFLDFVLKNPEWQRGNAKSIFVDKLYLSHWATPSEPGTKSKLSEPVVHVSWFAANAFCQSLNARLPTTDEWEYVASTDDAEKRDSTILSWYSMPTDKQQEMPSTHFKGRLGIENMYGKVWEWTLDFNSSLVTGESREDTSLSRSLFCGAGSIGSTDPTAYTTFMRFAFRSGLKGNYALPALGFRCAMDTGDK